MAAFTLTDPGAPSAPKAKAGPRAPKTERTQGRRTVDGVTFVDAGIGCWRVADTDIVAVHYEGVPGWDVHINGALTFGSGSLAGVVRVLRQRGLIEETS